MAVKTFHNLVTLMRMDLNECFIILYKKEDEIFGEINSMNGSQIGGSPNNVKFFNNIFKWTQNNYHNRNN